jgi:hypothetical protein
MSVPERSLTLAAMRTREIPAPDFSACLWGLGLNSAAPAWAQLTASIIERPYWQHRVDLFRRLPNPDGEIVFLGDGIAGEGSAVLRLRRTAEAGLDGRSTSGSTTWTAARTLRT